MFFWRVGTFTTLTSFITQQITVNVQFVFLCKNWNNSPHPYNLLSPRLCMQLPCCFVTGDVHVVCSAMVQHYLCFVSAIHLLATHSIMRQVGIDGGWVVKSKEFWYALDTTFNEIMKIWGVLQSKFHIFMGPGSSYFDVFQIKGCIFHLSISDSI